jgi:hypothetical protein
MLRRWLVAAPDRTKAALAARLGCTRVAVHNWLALRTRPRAEYRAILFAITGIPLDSWLTTAQRRSLRAAERVSANTAA